ncbi:hypothetical protein [Micromonospora sp. NPDC049274]|uniref:hypothetical protein n=1 Tax=Micromonospora sp. NPDC049274 TaxID=3154829 RepID=UPI00343D1721
MAASRGGELGPQPLPTPPASDRTARLLVSRDDGRTFLVAREYGPVVGSVCVAPGYAWLFGRAVGSVDEPDHLLLTTDATTWARFTLAP